MWGRDLEKLPDHVAEEIDHACSDASRDGDGVALPFIPPVDHRPKPQAHEQPKNAGEQDEGFGGHEMRRAENPKRGIGLQGKCRNE